MIPTLTMNPCLDVSGEIPRLIADRKLRCSTVRREPGGGGINVSRVLVRLGGASRAIFPSGQAGGKVVETMLQAEGVVCDTVAHQGYFRQSLAVRQTDDGKMYRFALPGPEIDQTTWCACLDKITGDDPPAYLVLSGTLPPGVPEDFYRRIADHFRHQRTKIILDTSGVPLRQALNSRLFLIKPNRRELEDFFGHPLEDQTRQEQVCRKIVDRYDCHAVALTLGAAGALLTTAEDQFRIPGLEVEPLSPVGAGDSFVGAMARALEQGASLRRAFLYGMAAGTAALITPGSELCHKEDTEEYYRQLMNISGYSD
jgi:6-phosphofructokinase 2